MTVKEIARAVGQTDRSVRNWVVKLAEKSSVIKEKSSVSSPMRPADYTLEETCAIIAEGMGKEAADVYRANATYTAMEGKWARKLPSGAQMLALEKIYGTKEAQQRIDFAMGYEQLPAPMPQLSKQAYAVEIANRAKAEAKAITEAKTPELFYEPPMTKIKRRTNE